MPGSGTAELYFIAAMMVLILVISFAAVYFFFRQYKKEMAVKASDKQANQDELADELSVKGSPNSKSDG